jgi:outer membrane protein assembly factor BamB
MSDVRRVAIALVTGCLLVIAAATDARAFPVKRPQVTTLWEDRTLGSGFGTAVVVQGRRVFAGGFEQTESGDVDFVRAYDSTSGSQLWEYRAPRVGGNSVLLAELGTRVFVARGSEPVRAHDARTGDVVWETSAGLSSASITAAEHRVIVTGTESTSTVECDPFGCELVTTNRAAVSALDARSGRLLWQYRSSPAVRLFNAAYAADLSQGLVAVAGSIGNRFAVWVFDADTGDSVWEDAGDVDGAAFVVTNTGSTIAVAGTTIRATQDSLFIRAYDRDTGQLLWETDVVPTPNVEGHFAALASDGDRLFAGGTTGNLIVQAHDLHTGRLLWRHEPVSQFGEAMGVAVSQSAVYAAGRSAGAWLLQAYDPETGTLLWEDRPTTGSGFLRDVAVDRRHVFVVGEDGPALVKAYDVARKRLGRDERRHTDSRRDTK